MAVRSEWCREPAPHLADCAIVAYLSPRGDEISFTAGLRACVQFIITFRLIYYQILSMLA